MRTPSLAPRIAVAAVLLLLALAGAVAMLGQGGTAQAAQRAATAPAPATVVEVTGELPGGAHSPDEAFIADLLGPDTDLDPEQARQLVELAHRYCDKVVTGVGHVEGAEVQTREGWLASLTMPGDPHAMTLDEATKLLDVAEAAYCPGTRA